MSLIKSHRKPTAVIVPAIFAWVFTALGTVVLKDYGWSVFIFTPFFIGLCATVIWGLHFKATTREYFDITTLSLLLFCAGLVLFALEGVICIIMAAPLGLIISFLGVFFGQAIVKYKQSTLPIVIGLTCFIPALMGFESKYQKLPELYSTTTSVIIDQPKEKVWNEVITFSKIAEPTEWFFNAGIAYPTHAEIIGTGKGAIRYCNFSTGRFVEPITEWKESELLQFSVLETPAPLKEISPYDINPAHLHEYFVSKKGQFKLTALPGGRTLLEGTTWYTHKIKPGFYWKFWSDYIIHKIHSRVLSHIKNEVESGTKTY